MKEVVFGAQTTNQIRGPAIASGLPCQRVVSTIDLLKESVEVPAVFARGFERLRTLENDDVSLEDPGDLTRTLPRQPHLLSGTKAAVEITLLRAHG